MTDEAINHDEIDGALKRCGSSWNAAQVHGLLCSRLAVGGEEGARRWFDQVLDETDRDSAPGAECVHMLDSLCAATWRQLVERQSEFTLLLPDDEDAAELRAESMAQWCEGYLHGLVAEKHSDELKSKLAAEPLADIIKDMLQMTRAAADHDGDDEGVDNAYAELVEYLRVAAQLVYEELADFRSPAGQFLPDGDDTLH